MVLVNSRQSIWLLTKRFLKINRGRNIIAILAVIMTAVLFTGAFTAAVSVLQSSMNQDMRTSMDSSQIAIQDLTQEQFQEISGYEKIKEMGYTIFLSVAENEDLKTTSAEIRYGDEKGAESYMCLPQTGTLPKEKDEAAVSTIVLDLLGIPHEIGARIPLTFTVSGQQVTEEFRLSGYWKGDSLAQSQLVWVSEDYCLSHMKTATSETLALGDYEGGYNMSLWFDNVFRLNQYKEEIDQRYEISDSQARIDIPPAYDRLFGEDGFPFLTVAALVLLIFLSGYLIIFNVFQISVKNDIRAYGLLKNIGATGRQLKKIVRRQALILSGIGIPIGLVLGWLAGRGMTPYLIDPEPGMEVLVSGSPWIFLAGALFSLITVYISCMLPCQAVAKVAPVEAVRMTEGAKRMGKKKIGKKRTGKASPAALAFGNFRRTWGKSLLVILSLSLPVFLLNCAYVVQKGFHFELYVDTYISSDFHLTGCGNSGRFSDLNALTPEILKDLQDQENVESQAVVYDTEIRHTLNEKEYQTLEAIMDQAEQEGIYDPAWAAEERKLLENSQIPAHVLGINREAFEKMTFQKEDCTWEEFVRGDYVIVGYSKDGFGYSCEPGDIITLELEGQKRDFQVLASGNLPYDLEYPFSAGTYYDGTFYLPRETYLQMGGNAGAMHTGIQVKEGEEKAFAEWLGEYLSDKPQISEESRMEVEQECSQFAGKYIMILSLLSGLLFIIGVLNFFNTSAVSVLSRKRELSLLEAVGMTKKQIQRMLCLESGFSFGLSLALADTFGYWLMGEVVMGTAGRSFFFIYEPSVAASLAACPILAAIAVTVPRYHYKRICRESIVERIRIE